MKEELYDMLKKSAETDLAKARLTFRLLNDYGVGVGEHSTEDFYDNAEEALRKMADAMDRLEALAVVRQELEGSVDE